MGMGISSILVPKGLRFVIVFPGGFHAVLLKLSPQRVSIDHKVSTSLSYAIYPRQWIKRLIQYLPKLSSQ